MVFIVRLVVIAIEKTFTIAIRQWLRIVIYDCNELESAMVMTSKHLNTMRR